MLADAILEQLTCARRIADHARLLGVRGSIILPRATSDHLGAVLADAILQAGVNYQSVVRTRIERIQLRFPETMTLHGLTALIKRDAIEDFLLWKNHIKIERFITLSQFLATQGIDTVAELRHWLCLSSSRTRLLNLHGVGPKTCDYLSCLVGIDSIAVDRHIKTFASEAGVGVRSYEYLKSVVCYAADLLNMTRRDFDAWIWRTVSVRKSKERMT